MLKGDVDLFNHVIGETDIAGLWFCGVRFSMTYLFPLLIAI